MESGAERLFRNHTASRRMNIFNRNDTDTDTPTKPVRRSVTRESGGLTDCDFKLHETIYPDGHCELPTETMAVAVLMDLRDQLRLLNERLILVEQHTQRTIAYCCAG